MPTLQKVILPDGKEVLRIMTGEGESIFFEKNPGEDWKPIYEPIFMHIKPDDIPLEDSRWEQKTI